MTRLKVILLSLFAVFAVSAVASASASAKTCDDATTTEDACLYVETTERISEEFAFTGTKTAATESKLEVAGGPVIKCTVANASGKLTAQGDGVNADDVVIEFKTCTVTNTANCEVKEPIIAEANGNFSTGNRVVDFREDGIGPFTTIVLKSIAPNTCLFATTGAKITGHQECKLEATAALIETEATTHKIECVVGDSKDLHYKNLAAKFELNETVSLGGKTFSLGAS